MDTQAEVKDFLTTRRGKLTPDQAGLPTFGGSRRVPGLRREEVALLAGVSVDYYTRLERGNLQGVSDIVLDALARALQLDDPEREHLFNLARAQSASPRPRRRRPPRELGPAVQQMLDAIHAPAYIRNGRMDVLAANTLGRALYAPVFDTVRQPPNTARFAFLDPRAHDFFRDWETTADDAVAVLNAEAGRNPHDRDLTELIGELSTQSDAFRQRWARHDVRYHDRGSKRLHHPNVGDLDLNYQVMKLLGGDELTMFIYTADPGSRTAESLDLLASWAAVDADSTTRA